jgi:tetratricopeptide (TPR) repeat protein
MTYRHRDRLHPNLKFVTRNWWYDPWLNEFGYRFPTYEPTQFRDLQWNFHEPDSYASIVAERKPGIFASSGEKAFHAAVAGGDPHTIDLSAGQHPEYRNVADALAGLMSIRTYRSRAIDLLERAVRDGAEPAEHPFIATYLPDAGVTVPVAPGAVVHLPIMRTSLALTLAELLQESDQGLAAIEVLHLVEQTTHVRLSMVELLCQVGQFDAVAAITEGVRNDDDVTALTIVFRAIAQRERGDRQEAAAALTEALVYTNRAQEIRHMARVQRALLAADDGKHLTAKVELERVLAENPDHIAAADLLASLRTGDRNRPAGGSPSTA